MISEATTALLCVVIVNIFTILVANCSFLWNSLFHFLVIVLWHILMKLLPSHTQKTISSTWTRLRLAVKVSLLGILVAVMYQYWIVRLILVGLYSYRGCCYYYKYRVTIITNSYSNTYNNSYSNSYTQSTAKGSPSETPPSNNGDISDLLLNSSSGSRGTPATPTVTKRLFPFKDSDHKLPNSNKKSVRFTSTLTDYNSTINNSSSKSNSNSNGMTEQPVANATKNSMKKTSISQEIMKFSSSKYDSIWKQKPLSITDSSLGSQNVSPLYIFYVVLFYRSILNRMRGKVMKMMKDTKTTL